MFAKDSENPKPPADPDKPQRDKYYKVTTSVVGCEDSSLYELTPTTSVKEGSNHTVEWKFKADNTSNHVVKIEVDGVEYDAADSKSIPFTGIKDDHNVVITLEKLPSLGGNTSDGHYTVTVNRYGGDNNVTVSESMVVDAGAKAPVSWDMNNTDYRVYKVLIDGTEYAITDPQQIKYTLSKKPLNNIQANHVVDIYIGEPNEKGEPELPDYTNDKFIKVDTEFTGAAGTITGGAVLKVGSDYEVEWDLIKTVTYVFI